MSEVVEFKSDSIALKPPKVDGSGTLELSIGQYEAPKVAPVHLWSYETDNYYIVRIEKDRRSGLGGATAPAPGTRAILFSLFPAQYEIVEEALDKIREEENLSASAEGYAIALETLATKYLDGEVSDVIQTGGDNGSNLGAGRPGDEEGSGRDPGSVPGLAGGEARPARRAGAEKDPDA
jgi:hypothetical protein